MWLVPSDPWVGIPVQYFKMSIICLTLQNLCQTTLRQSLPVVCASIVQKRSHRSFHVGADYCSYKHTQKSQQNQNSRRSHSQNFVSPLPSFTNLSAAFSGSHATIMLMQIVAKVTNADLSVNCPSKISRQNKMSDNYMQFSSTYWLSELRRVFRACINVLALFLSSWNIPTYSFFWAAF